MKDAFGKLAKLIRNLVTIDARLDELRNDVAELKSAFDKLESRLDLVNLRVDKIYELLLKMNNRK